MASARAAIPGLVTALAVSLGACSYGHDIAPGRSGVALPDGPDRGRVLYLRDCAWCHGDRGEGTDRGPDLDGELDGPAYTDFMLTTGRMPLADPADPTVRAEPAYSAPEIDDLVAYVASFGGGGPEVPRPDPTAGDLALGAELYLENCAACHSSTGVGGALTSGRTAPSLLDSTPVQVAEAMLVGPGCLQGTRTCAAGEGAMPIFELDNREVDAIVAYIDNLQTTGARGGAELGRLGPFSEGAVAWLIGLLALVVLVRSIGTKVSS